MKACGLMLDRIDLSARRSTKWNSTRTILDVANEIADFEEEVKRLLSEDEGLENACAD